MSVHKNCESKVSLLHLICFLVALISIGLMVAKLTIYCQNVCSAVRTMMFHVLSGLNSECMEKLFSGSRQCLASTVFECISAYHATIYSMLI